MQFQSYTHLQIQINCLTMYQTFIDRFKNLCRWNLQVKNNYLWIHFYLMHICKQILNSKWAKNKFFRTSISGTLVASPKQRMANCCVFIGEIESEPLVQTKNQKQKHICGCRRGIGHISSRWSAYSRTMLRCLLRFSSTLTSYQ